MKLRKVVGWSMSAAMLLFAAGTAIAEDEGESRLNATVSAAYSSKYVWRGQNVNDTSVLQPNVSGSAYGFTGSIWGNIDLTDTSQTAPGNSGDFSEIDYTLDYSRSFSKVGFSLGVIHYLFPNTALQSTTEIYGGLSLAVPLSPKITWYRDVKSVDGSYIQLTAGHTFPSLAKWNDDYSVGLSLTGSLAVAGSGYNRGYFRVDGTRFNDFMIGVGVPFTLKSVSITPSINVSTMLSERIGNSTFERNNVWFGVGVSKGF